jgi:predicted acyltransferase
MSATTPSSTTDRVVKAAQSAADLATSAEQIPAVKAELQTLFDSYSHSPIVAGLVPVVAGFLTQEHVTVDSTLLTVGIGLVVTGIGYAWQWLSMKINKPVATPAAPAA